MSRLDFKMKLLSPDYSSTRTQYSTTSTVVASTVVATYSTPLLYSVQYLLLYSTRTTQVCILVANSSADQLGVPEDMREVSD
jgi:hypothetical protein